MPATISHSLSMTTPNDPAYENQPQHWNQPHAFTINATGSEISNAFSNANGLSFGLSAGAITASYTVPTQSNQTGGVYHVGNTTGQSSSSTYDLRTLSIDGAGIVSAGWSAGSIRISATQSNQAWSGSNASSTFQTLSFGNANGASWSNNAGVVNLSYTVPTVTNSSMSVSDAATSGTLARLAFTNLNGVTLSLSTGAGGSHTIVGSHNALTSQSNQQITAANGGFAFQTLSFSNLNGISFGTSAGSAITASHNALTTARASTDAIGLNTAQTNVTWTVNSSGLSLNAAGYAGTGTSATNASITVNSNGLAISVAAGGGVNPVASASNGSFSFTTLNFSNANNVTFGTSAGSIITASVAAPGAAAENNWVNLLGANTAGNTTASGSTIGYSGINLTLSGTNGSVVNISAPATSSLVGANGISVSTNGSTISIQPVVASGFAPYPDREIIGHTYGAGTVVLDPEVWPAFQCDRIVFPIVNTNSSNSSGSHSISFYWGMYTRNNSTLSLLTSTSSSTAVTHSGTAGSYSLYSGIRNVTIPFTTTFTAGEYWVAYMSRTTSGGTNGSYSNMCVSNVASAFNGFFGSSLNTTYQLTLGQGVYTVSSSSLPGSIAFTQIRGSDSAALRFPKVFFASGTI